MTRDAATTPPEAPVSVRTAERERRHRRLILAALAGPVIWAVHFLLVYLLAELACRTGVLSGSLLGMTLLAWVTLTATLLALVVVGWVGVAAFRDWQHRRGGAETRRSRRLDQASRIGGSPDGFLVLAGWVLGLLFGAMIVLTAVPILVLAPCPWM